MARVRLTVGFFSAVFLLAVTTGCPEAGAPTARVTGKVTVGGQPIPDNASAALISFRPVGSNQSPGVSAEIKDGAYDVPNAPTGNVMVEFNILVPTGESKSFDGVARPEAVQKNLVPADKAAGISKQIDGDTTLDFDL